MMFTTSTLGASLLALASTVYAAPSPLQARSTDLGCTNSPTTRDCWANGFSSSTNHYDKFPSTGNTVKYALSITNEKMSPNGFEKDMMVFNKQYPGPAIVADWGDIIQVTVTNNLVNGNGSGIHWHGMRQLNSNEMDGTNGITECPIPPGGSRTYTFKATEYGTSWYHSHYSAQYADGLTGPIIINGPASANYDIDLGPLALTDWFHTPVFEIMASRPPGPPLSQDILVNGTGNFQGTGKWGSTKLTPGKVHRLRLINNGINNYLHVSLDNHPFTVISNDFVSIKPYVTTSLSINVGQRYDVLINADQIAGNYWFRVNTGGGSPSCDGPNLKAASNDTRAYIFSYEGTDVDDPVSDSYTLGTGCTEETNLTPIVSMTVPAPTGLPFELHLLLDATQGAVWKVNNQMMIVDWNKPSLQYVMNGTYTLPPTDNGLIIDAEGWSYWYIQNDTPVPHPMHLHGHDFLIIGTGQGNATASSPLSLDNPIRRDTHTVPAFGYLMIAFQADNPGAWLMHCHIPFHIATGLGVQFLERPKEIEGLLGNAAVFTDGCAAWNAFSGVAPSADVYDDHYHGQDDSGL